MNVKTVNENLNEFLGLSVAEKFQNLDPNDGKKVNDLFNRAFKYILMNPYMSVIAKKADGLSSEEKYDLLKQFVDCGSSGTLRLKDGKIVCVPENKIK